MPMGLSDPITLSALLAVALLLLSLLLFRRWKNGHARSRSAAREALDTVHDWPPEAARVMTVTERRAYELLRSSLPGLLVLAQVPLSRFLRVPSRHSHSEWLHRVGSLSADLLVCDTGSRVLAVIDIRSKQETERSRRRHERMQRVLKAAHISVHVWSEASMPSAAEVRTLLGAELERANTVAARSRGISSRPMPLIPVAEMEELVAQGDLAHAEAAFDPRMEPVASAFFDDMESAPRAARPVLH